jgi:hypothetical protein
MRTRIASVNHGSESLIPPAKPDNSGIGVNYADAYLEGLNLELADGRRVSFRRKGLKIIVGVGAASGDALMRKREHGPDPRVILRRALEEAAARAGYRFIVEEGVVYLELAG